MPNPYNPNPYNEDQDRARQQPLYDQSGKTPARNTTKGMVCSKSPGG